MATSTVFGPSGSASIAIGSKSQSTTNYGASGSAPKELPKISGVQRTSGTLTIDESMLTGVVSREWYSNDVATGSTGTTFTPPTANVLVRCDVVDADGTVSSPSVYIYGDHSEASHNTMDDAILALIPHTDATHVFIGADNADWSDSSSWDVGTVPGVGDVPLIQAGKICTYDIASSPPRLDRLRIDGELKMAIDQNTEMLVETVFVSRGGGKLTQGTSSAPIGDAYTCTITFSGRDYRTSPSAASSINYATDPEVLGRGLLVLGEWESDCKRIDAHAWCADGEAPMAGDTKVTLAAAATGWSVGDTIIIPGILVDINSDGTNNRYDEERVITSITTTTVTNDTINFSGALSYDHDHFNSSVSRTDLVPPIFLKTRGIILESEVTTPVYRRAHSMIAHGASSANVRGVKFVEMGRTDKTGNVGKKSGSNFVDWTGATSTMDSTKNIQARYPAHFHVVGFNHAKGTRPMMRDCFVDGSPGWGFAHHDCDIAFHRCNSYRFVGAGMVSEQGSEAGFWSDCFSFGLAGGANASYGAPKGAIGNAGKLGDIGREGYGFFSRGRAININGSYAIGCTWGHVFYHRNTDAGTIQIRKDTARTSVSYPDINLTERDYETTIAVNRFPILNWSENGAIGCYGAMGVVKAISAQEHDIMSVWRKMKGFACRRGVVVEYVGNYLIEDFDLVGTDQTSGGSGITYPGGSGLHTAFATAKDETITLSRFIAEGFNIGAALVGATLSNSDTSGGTLNNGDFDGTDDPRYILSECDFTGCTTETTYTDQGSQPATTASVTKIYATEPSAVTPSTDLPFILGSINGTSMSGVQTGLKTDSVSSAQPLPKTWDGCSLIVTSAAETQGLRNYWQANGYETYSGTNIIRVPVYVSDRISGRPVKEAHAYTILGSVSGYTNNGAFTLPASAPTRADITASLDTSTDSEASIDVLTAATGTGTITFDPAGAYNPPDHGDIYFNGNDVEYVPHPNYTGTDVFYVFIYNGKYTSVKVTVTVT